MEYLFTGTYTGSESMGIYVSRIDPITAETTPCDMCEIENPSYIALHSPNGCVYSVTENEKGKSYANSFIFDRERGLLVLVNRQETGGAGACYISVDPLGKFAVTANYGGGTISVFPIEDTGRLSPTVRNVRFHGHGTYRKRQGSSHPHCAVFSPDGKYLFVTDLGTDKIYRFSADYQKDTLIAHEPEHTFTMRQGSGPRHIVFHPGGEFVYIINELSGTVTGCRYGDGSIVPIEEKSVGPQEQEGGGSIALSPDGTYLCASLREGNDGIALFAIDTEGRLDRKGFYASHRHPREITVTPDGKLLLAAAMKDGVVDCWSISADGSLSGHKVLMSVDSPAFVGIVNQTFNR